MILKFLMCIFFFPGFIPVCSLGVAQVGRLNFGKDVSTLKYFTICGLQEGYEPFAVNTNRDITMWLSKRLPQFLQVPSNHVHLFKSGNQGHRLSAVYTTVVTHHWCGLHVPHP